MLLSRCCTHNVQRHLGNRGIYSRLFGVSSFLRSGGSLGSLKTPEVDYEAKYTERLQKKANEEGLSVAQLKERLKEQERAKRKEMRAAAAVKENQSPAQSASQAPLSEPSVPPLNLKARTDSSPVKPLSSIFNLDKLLEKPHTPEQISLLWRVYHASRSGGTGRGYICATIPADTYEKMLSIAKRYPYFVIPLPREEVEPESTGGESKEQRPLEFHFMEWGFHHSPAEPRPSSIDGLFTRPQPGDKPNPQTSTILFTPLGEYKMRNTFATPYLVITNYTDLARSHGIVLLRGEITPSSGAGAGGDARYLLSQQDAQLLAMAIQKYYVWDEAEGVHKNLLKTFHDDPSNFKWEDLVKHTDFTA